MIDKKTEEFLEYLTGVIQQEIKPHLGTAYAKQQLGKAIGGDVTFAIDEKAEEILHEELGSFGNIAYYSEDKGLIVFGEPNYILVIDPVDGTRAAAAGLETATVSIAAAKPAEQPQIGDVIYGIMRELKNGSYYSAKIGEGVKFDGKPANLLKERHDCTMENLFWTIGFRGRPAMVIALVLGELMDKSSVGGGIFDIGSATYSIWMVIEGRIDAYVDVGKRIIEEVPEVYSDFSKVGHGKVLNNSPYDIAAAKIIAEEMGCIVTDGYGNSLDEKPLLGSSHQFQVSCIASANKKLHEKIVTEIDKGIEKLKKDVSQYTKK